MTKRTRNVSTKVKRSRIRSKKAAPKALKRTGKKPARRVPGNRTRGSQTSIGAALPTVAVYEVVETQVYQEPVVEAEDQEL